MCFSASASFVAGTSLSAFGAATLRNTLSGAERPFAMIPLLFGIQQITEGIIWVTFTQEASALKQAMTYVYSVFSHVFLAGVRAHCHGAARTGAVAQTGHLRV